MPDYPSFTYKIYFSEGKIWKLLTIHPSSPIKWVCFKRNCSACLVGHNLVLPTELILRIGLHLKFLKLIFWALLLCWSQWWRANTPFSLCIAFHLTTWWVIMFEKVHVNLIEDVSQSILIASNIIVTRPAYACLRVAESTVEMSSSPAERKQDPLLLLHTGR